MGPRSRDRGMGSGSRWRPNSTQIASMGPRSRDRGMRPTRLEVTRDRNVLQWGRGRATAECGVPVTFIAALAPASMGPRSRDRGMCTYDGVAIDAGVGLQWGRGRATAEWALALPRGQRQRLRASMGPRSRDRGMAEAAESPAASPTASMGPRSRDRGMMRRCADGRQVFMRFNGAAVARPRNVRPFARIIGGHHHASMGPRSRDRGMGSPRSSATAC